MVEKEEVKKKNTEKRDSGVRIGIYCNDWSPHLLKEWEDDCKQNYNNIRWIKMYQDHKQARLLETILDLFGTMKADVEELKERVLMMEKGKTSDEEDESVPLMGGGTGR